MECYLFFSDINVTRIGKDLNNEFLILHLSGKLQKGIGYELGIEFKGFITDEAKGFYIADSNKRKKRYLFARFVTSLFFL